MGKAVKLIIVICIVLVIYNGRELTKNVDLGLMIDQPQVANQIADFASEDNNIMVLTKYNCWFKIGTLQEDLTTTEKKLVISLLKKKYIGTDFGKLDYENKLWVHDYEDGTLCLIDRNTGNTVTKR